MNSNFQTVPSMNREQRAVCPTCFVQMTTQGTCSLDCDEREAAALLDQIDDNAARIVRLRDHIAMIHEMAELPQNRHALNLLPGAEADLAFLSAERPRLLWEYARARGVEMSFEEVPSYAAA